MYNVRALINYATTDKPWGGSNSFLSALKFYLKTSDSINIVENVNENFDLMLLNTAYAAPGKYISLGSIRSFHKYGYPNYFRFLGNSLKKKSVKIILRLDGLRKFYSDTSNAKGDSIQLALIQYADAIIFQSKESLNQFKSIKGELPVPHFIIYNGVNQNIFNLKNKLFWNNNNKLNIFTTSWSTNLRKGFSDIASLSLLKDVTVNFVGKWPEEIGKRNVHIKPPMPQNLLAEEYKKNDIFFFPSRNEACPNVILEALACGLPVIYHTSGGTPEIASAYGVPLTNDIREDIKKLSADYVSIIKKIRADHHLFSIDYAGSKYAEVFHKVTNTNTI